MKINLNDVVRVKLTKLGKSIHRSNHEVLASGTRLEHFPYIPPKEDAEGWSEWQLWRLMQEFGPHTKIGFDVCFETTMEIPDPKTVASHDLPPVGRTSRFSRLPSAP